MMSQPLPVFNVGDLVMLYAKKGIVRCVREKEYIISGETSGERQLIGVQFEKDLLGMESSVSSSDQSAPSGARNIVFVPSSSLKPFDEREAAATRIQAFVRMSINKLKYIREMSFLFWDRMESLKESQTLANKRDISLPIIKRIMACRDGSEGRNGKNGISEPMLLDQPNFEGQIPDPHYSGPKLGKAVTAKFAHELLDAYMSGTTIQLPVEYAYRILMDTLAWYEKNDKGVINYVQLPPYENGNLILVGDLHGQLNDLLWIFYKFGPPSSHTVYVFNGDIADRGMFATNIFLLLFAFKLADPGSVIINRGNHESEDMNETYGFAKEVRSKYNSHIYNLFQRIFFELPLAVIIEKRIIVVHGGLFRYDGVTLDAISKVNRKRMCSASPETFEDSIMFDLLWADPQNDPGRGVSTRGIDCIRFGPDVTDEFLDLNNLEVCIRSHQVPSTLKGIETNHGGRCVTLFSASNYCQTTGNTGAVLIITKGLHFEAKEYMSPSLDSIHALANNTNVVTNKVIDAALSRELEMNQNIRVKRSASEKILEDIILKISELVCENKQMLWIYCYNRDTNKSGAVTPDVWRDGLSDIAGTSIPRLFAIRLLKIVDEITGMVHYNDVLKRFYIGFEPVGYSHENMKRECIAHMFDTMIKSDLSLKEILMVFDRNLDGVVSYAELDETIRKLNIGLSNPQIKILMRTILSTCIDNKQGGKADIVEFLSKLKVIYSSSVSYKAKEDWMEPALSAIGRVILSDRTEVAARYYDPSYGLTGQSSSAAAITKGAVNRKRSSAIRAVALFQKFQDYDKLGCGILSYSDFVEALKQMDLSRAEEELGFKLEDHHLMEIARMIDVTNTSKINYLEFLQAFYVVDKNKYSVVNEMWDHICSTLYKHRDILRHALNSYNNNNGAVFVDEFKEVLHALYETLGYKKAPFTFEQTGVLVECIDTNEEGMIMYNDFLESFRPIYSYK